MFSSFSYLGGEEEVNSSNLALGKPLLLSGRIMCGAGMYQLPGGFLLFFYTGDQTQDLILVRQAQCY